MQHCSVTNNIHIRYLKCYIFKLGIFYHKLDIYHVYVHCLLIPWMGWGMKISHVPEKTLEESPSKYLLYQKTLLGKAPEWPALAN